LTRRAQFARRLKRVLRNFTLPLLAGGSLVLGIFFKPQFFDLFSFLFTVGGAVAVTGFSYSRGQLRGLWAAVRGLFAESPESLEQHLAELNRLAGLFRLKGLRGLENQERHIADPYLRHAVSLLVDLHNEETIRARLEHRFAACVARHEINRQILATLGKLLPSFGLIGTLIGMVLLLSKISSRDPGSLPAALGLAVLTTLYGAAPIGGGAAGDPDAPHRRMGAAAAARRSRRHRRSAAPNRGQRGARARWPRSARAGESAAAALISVKRKIHFRAPHANVQPRAFAPAPLRLSAPPPGDDGNWWVITLSDLTLLLLGFMVVWYAATSAQSAPAAPSPAAVAAPQAPASPELWRKMGGEFLAAVKAAGLADDVTVESMPDELVISLRDTIPFASGKADLRPRALPVLEKVVALILRDNSLSVAIGGHTDSLRIA